jgi:C-terminal processing protease CtpA/Prc
MARLVTICALFLLHCLPAYSEPEPNAYLHNFDLVWQTVIREHFDPDFGGVDWAEIIQRYRPLLQQIDSLEEFTRLTNRMLYEFKLSHLMLVSHRDLERYVPTLFAAGAAGIEVRWLNNRALITGIAPGSAAEIAGLQAGYVMTRIDDRSIPALLAAVEYPPPFNPRSRDNFTAKYLTGLLDGPPGTAVRLNYLDAADREHECTLVRSKRDDGRIISPALPAFHIEFEMQRIDNNLGYIRFNHFAPPVDRFFDSALSTLADTKGLIIDLRGNSGGYFDTMDHLLAALIDTETPLYRMVFRYRTVVRTIKPATAPYRQPLVLLIDVTSMSASELFAACLQTLGRAIIIGERSPGYMLGAKWSKLPNGLSFMHPNLLPLPIYGRPLEGVGVIPDVEMHLERAELLAGKDTQLDTAVEYILHTADQ